MDFKLKDIFSLDSAVSGVLSAAEIKAAMVTTIASSALVVSGGGLEVQSQSASKVQIQAEKAQDQAFNEPSVSVPPEANDANSPIDFVDDQPSFDSKMYANFQKKLHSPTSATQLASANTSSLAGPKFAYSSSRHSSNSYSNSARSASSSRSRARRGTSYRPNRGSSSVSKGSRFSRQITTASNSSPSGSGPEGSQSNDSEVGGGFGDAVLLSPGGSQSASDGTALVGASSSTGGSSSSGTSSGETDETTEDSAPTLSIADAASIAEDSGALEIRDDAAVQADKEGTGSYSFVHTSTTAPNCDDNKVSLSIDASTGAVTYQPAADYNGTCNITVQFDDGNGGTVSDEFSVTVTPVNDAPVASATCPATINEDAAYSCSVAPVATDADTGDSQAWSLDATNTCAWASINASTGVVSGTPVDNQVGSCTLAFKSNDGTVDSNIITVAVTVVNTVPALTISDSSTQLNSSEVEVRADADVQASDEGSGTYSFDHTTTTSPKCDDNKLSISINAATGAIQYKPAVDYSGTCNVKVQFDDANGGSVTDEFAISVVTTTPGLDISLDNCSAFPTEVSFSRASTATYFDNSGVMLTAAVNSPRCDHDALTTTAKGLLIEETRENVATYSESLSASIWTGHALVATVTDDVSSAPDLNTTADKIDDESTGLTTSVRQQQLGAADNETWTCSAFLKRDPADPPTNNSSAIRCRLSGGTAIGPYVVVDWNTHTVSSFGSTPVAIGIKQHANDWYRVWVTVENDTSGNNQVNIVISPALDSSASATPTGAVFVWGAQIEKGETPSSYIPTTTTATTRAADIATLTNLSFFDTDKGSLVADFQVPTQGSSLQPILEFNDSTDQNWHRLYLSANATLINYGVQRSGANQGTITGYSLVAEDTEIKTGYIYDSTNLDLYKDGISQGAQAPTGLPAPLTSALLGQDTDGNFLNGYIKTIQYWNYTLSTEAIDSKTTP